MPKISIRIFSAFSGALILCAVVLRCMLMRFFETSSSGFDHENAERIAMFFYSFCVLSVLSCFMPLKKSALKNPFFKKKSKIVFYACVSAGAAMLYDFIFQCVHIYKLILNGSFSGVNYTVPLCLTAVVSVLCACYFIIMGISYKTDKYDFRCFKYYHIIPVCRYLFAAYATLTKYENGIYYSDNVLYYAVLIFGMLYFILFLICLDGNNKMLLPFCFFGFSYSALCFILAVPGIFCFVAGNAAVDTDFSYVSFLLMGIFAAVFTASSFQTCKPEEG